MEIKDKKLHRIAATAIIYREDGKYLICQRNLNEKAFPGMWTVPGGQLSVDDYINSDPTTSSGQWYGTLEKALIREVKEEVGVEIGKSEYLLDLTFVRPDGIPVLVLSYFARYVSGEVILSDEMIDFAWVSSGESQKYDLIEGIREEIEMVDKILLERKNN